MNDLEIEKLKEQNRKLKKCVEFYADYNNWYNQTIDQCDCEDIIREVMNFNGEPELIREASMGGILARQTLKEIEE